MLGIESEALRMPFKHVIVRKSSAHPHPLTSHTKICLSMYIFIYRYIHMYIVIHYINVNGIINVHKFIHFYIQRE